MEDTPIAETLEVPVAGSPPGSETPKALLNTTAKKHHYVPKFYQKGFGDADGMLWWYDRRFKQYKHLHPQVICWEEDLYAIKQEDGSMERGIESHVLSPIDSASSNVFRKLEPEAELIDEDRAQLIMFIALQHTRLPSFGRAVGKIIEVEGDQWLRRMFGTVEKAKRAFAEYERETGNKLVGDPEKMVDSVLNRRVNAHARKGSSIKFMFDIANTLAHVLDESAWTILIAPSQSSFIICDQPFTIVPPKGNTFEGVGFGMPGTTCYFPLNHRLCLETHHGDYGFRYRHVGSTHVRTVNLNVAANSERFIMASSRDQLQAVVKRSGCDETPKGPRYSVETIEPDENNVFTKFVNLPGRYFY